MDYGEFVDEQVESESLETLHELSHILCHKSKTGQYTRLSVFFLPKLEEAYDLWLDLNAKAV